MKRPEKPISVAVLPTVGAIEGNKFAQMRYLVDFYGKENARIIFDLLSGDRNLNNQERFLIDKLTLESLEQHYPGITNERCDNDNYKLDLEEEINRKLENIRRILVPLTDGANQVVEDVVKKSFPDLEFSLGLLNPTKYPSLDFHKRLETIFSNQTSEKLRYELIRQILLSLIILNLQEIRLKAEIDEEITQITALFEGEMIAGKTGENQPYIFYTINDNKYNTALGYYPDLNTARKHKKRGQHIKKHRYNVREIDGIGLVLFDFRIKTFISATKKAIHLAINQTSERKKANPKKRVETVNVPDFSGLMFACEVGKEKELIERLKTEIRKVYPEAQIRNKDKKKKTEAEIANLSEEEQIKIKKGSSLDMEYLRLMVKLTPNSLELEIVVYNWIEYLNSKMHTEMSHARYDRSRTNVVANAFCPTNIYGHNLQEVQYLRNEFEKQAASDLRKKNRIK